MKFSSNSSSQPAPRPELDVTDRAILELLQENCKQPLAAIGQKVGLSAPSVVERIHKLEEAGVITAYVALLDAKKVGKDIAAFIGIECSQAGGIDTLERRLVALDPVQECHHVTGAHSLMVKVKARNTEALESLIDEIRSLDGVTRTETMVVLSTLSERPHIALDASDEGVQRPRRSRKGMK